MRDGWGPHSTWIEFNSVPYFAKHQHLDQNQFTICHKGYLAIGSGADYTDIESPHYLNYYRRTIAHNTMLVYKPGERFFWAETLWPTANDGGQRMDSSRYWNTIRSREDWRQTRDLWDIARMEAADDVPGEYQYARGNATRAYQPSKMEYFTRELVYTPRRNIRPGKTYSSMCWRSAMSETRQSRASSRLMVKIWLARWSKAETSRSSPQLTGRSLKAR